MIQFTSSVLICLLLAISALAQTPAPNVMSPGRVAASPKPAAASSPSASPTIEDLVNSLGPTDLQAVITLLKTNFTNPDAITDTELNRATVEGLIVRLPRGVMLLPARQRLIWRWPPSSRSGFAQKAKRFLPCASQRRVRTACSIPIVIRHFAA